jgi:prepilin-type N-terminal cleavage/methylation domain-containing protein/prepilin-type processing-associated H-X9-DG protein
MARTLCSIPPRRRGFTLVELLVVIFIIGILIGLLLPAVNMARESGRRSACGNNMRQIVQAIATYETANQSFPPGRAGNDAYAGSPIGPNQTGVQTSATSGFLLLLPQLDNVNLYNNFAPLAKGAVYPAKSDTTSTGWNTASILTGLATRPPVFICTSDRAKETNSILTPQTMTSSYAMVIGTSTNGNIVPGQSPIAVKPFPVVDELHQKYFNNGPFIYGQPRRANDVKDGLSSTYFVGETVDGDTPDSLNCWPLSVAYLCSLRSTYSPLNTQPGMGYLFPIVNSGLTGLVSSANGAFASRHPQGANFAYGGGNVKFTSEQIDYATYQALATIAGTEPLPADELH